MEGGESIDIRVLVKQFKHHNLIIYFRKRGGSYLNKLFKVKIEK